MSILHYKDLPEIAEPSVVMLDQSALDVWEYWFGVAESRGLVQSVLDITDVLETLTADTHIVEDLTRTPDAMIHFCVEPHSSHLAERLYHRGPYSISWDLADYVPGIAPIPEHVVSTPQCRGVLNIGGSAAVAHRSGLFWCSGGGTVPQGYPRLPGIQPSNNLDAQLWEFSTRDLGTVMRETQPGRGGIFTAHWRPRMISNTQILEGLHSEYPHTKRYAQEYRRRLRNLRAAIVRHEP